MTMETYYVSAYETYVRDYKVEANSKEINNMLRAVGLANNSLN